ncbi:hypothetical protein SAMN02745220_02745 [Desulfopila aestuarii DSM 18488]|uniref:Uncharacterized protein n=1 Tax=Desulfopila aestuarii DSM 18488 TaxID=1121416 RepID=A0A1M7Y9M4_9BACT|nr:hypothetical protein SAMN02745220_02745 [Desulfopila aestuarii DSM 18488]
MWANVTGPNGLLGGRPMVSSHYGYFFVVNMITSSMGQRKINNKATDGKTCFGSFQKRGF